MSWIRPFNCSLWTFTARTIENLTKIKSEINRRLTGAIKRLITIKLFNCCRVLVVTFLEGYNCMGATDYITGFGDRQQAKDALQ